MTDTALAEENARLTARLPEVEKTWDSGHRIYRRNASCHTPQHADQVLDGGLNVRFSVLTQMRQCLLKQAHLLQQQKRMILVRLPGDIIKKINLRPAIIERRKDNITFLFPP